MKLLVLSDNHGRWDLVANVVSTFRPQVDYIIHCGDSEFPSNDLLWGNVDVVVAGNMDFDRGYLQTATLDTPEGRIFVTHGHRHHVNQSNDALAQLAKENGYSFVFHGHTHVLYAEYQDGILLCNPGSLNHSRGSYHGTTFAVVEVEKTTLTVTYYDEQFAPIPSLTKHFTR